MINRFKPAAHRKWLILISGLTWAGVGIFLSYLSIKWMRVYDWQKILIVNAIGISLGLIKAFFVFNKVSTRNIERILHLPKRPCVFAFQDWKSYGLILLMMALGIFLRTNPSIPKYYIAPIYTAVGIALFIASFRYFKQFPKAEQS